MWYYKPHNKSALVFYIDFTGSILVQTDLPFYEAKRFIKTANHYSK